MEAGAMGARNDMTHSGCRSDEGVALITVIGVMMVVTLLAIGSYTLATQTLHEAVRVEDETRAFRAAQAGIDLALSTFDPTVFPEEIEGTTPDGSYVVTMEELATGAGEYELVSRGVGVDGLEESVHQRFFYINIWEMNFAGTGSQSLMSGSSGMNGQSNITGPFYIRGNLAVEANMSVMEGPVFVKGGKLSTSSGAATIGTSTRPVRVYCDGNVDVSKGDVHIEGPRPSVPDISLPRLTADDMRVSATKAAAESIDGRMGSAAPPDLAPNNLELVSFGGSAYKFFGETTSTIAPLGEGTTTLTLGGGGTSRGSWGRIDFPGGSIAAGGTNPYPEAYAGLHDDFAYQDNASGWDLLFISGTVFVDGPLIINDDIMYIGNGTIVANGPVTLKGRVRPYSHTTAKTLVNSVGEDMHWALGIVTPKDITANGQKSNDVQGKDLLAIRDYAFDYAGAFYTDGTFRVPQPLTSVRGTILANKMEFSSPNTDLVTNPLLPEYLPDSLPGGDQGIIVPGLWSRI
jgi:hypothetical protein